MKGTFTFLWPWVLILLALVPGLALWVLVQQRRYWHDAFQFSQVMVLKSLKHARHQVFHQRVLPVLLLVALAFGIVGLAQPVWKTKVATQNSYLMLVMDISISMEATDLSPNRLEAARKAAIDFTSDLPEGVKLGLEFFAGNSYLVSPPVENHTLITDYLKSLEMEDLRPSTALGDALLMALDSLQATINQEVSVGNEKPKPASQPQGSIILLTDGESNMGISPLLAVEEAVRQKVTVHTIGMGEETGAFVRGGIFTHLDETTLKTIAQQTGGDYYRARSFNDFKDIYGKITQKTLTYEEKVLPLMPWCLSLSLVCLLWAIVWGTLHRRF